MSLLDTARTATGPGYAHTPRVLDATEADLTECYRCGRECLVGLVAYAGMDFCGDGCLDRWSEDRAEQIMRELAHQQGGE